MSAPNVPVASSPFDAFGPDTSVLVQAMPKLGVEFALCAESKA